jgi:dTDP-4-dehydrorhamnose reductase
MKVLLLGANGQLGWELQRTCPDDVILISCDFPGVDFCSQNSIRQCIQTAQPNGIINAAGYTAVDKAEQEPDLAKVIWTALRHNATGIFHWTDAGVASWYDFSVAIQEEGLSIGLLDQAIPILPVPTHAYPTPAKRPHYSVLDKTTVRQTLGILPVHWRFQLRAMMWELCRRGLHEKKGIS